MANLVRFGVSIDDELLAQFDRLIQQSHYENRSEAIRDLIRGTLVSAQWTADELIAGGIALVYDHHHNQIVNRLLDIQHDFHELVVTSQHVHLDHDNCLEVIIVRGLSQDVKQLYERLKSIKGLKHINILKSTTGQTLA